MKLFFSSYFRTSVTIFFKDDDLFYSRRSELETVTDFIAKVGGLLGLFLGISALSIVEILYFALFRHLRSEQDKSSSEAAPTIPTTAIDIEPEDQSYTINVPSHVFD